MADTVGSAGKAVTYTCPNCNGLVEYNIKERKFMCASCNTVIDIPTDGSVDEQDFASYDLKEKASAVINGTVTVKCDSCGGEIFFSENETATRCPMCGSPSVRPTVAAAGIPPEAVVPFRIDKQDAGQMIRKWLSKRWYAPSRFKRAYGEGKLEGLYVPFWTYDADVTSRYSGRGGKNRTVKDEKGNMHTVTDWMPVMGVVHHSFDDEQVCGSAGESGNMVNRVAPYNTKTDIEPYTQQYLSGYKAERYTIDGKNAFQTARSGMESAMRSLSMSDILAHGFDTAEVTGISSNYANVTYKHVLVPVYTAQNNYQGKMYSCAINGQTGNISADYPKSVGKILLTILIILAVFVGIYMLVSGGGDSSVGALPEQGVCVIESSEAAPAAEGLLRVATGANISEQEVQTWVY